MMSLVGFGPIAMRPRYRWPGLVLDLCGLEIFPALCRLP